ncbi:MAG: hypothetical protein EZS28_009757 [Streblomastix strix]|uniref:Uncharacterized protein n=1 Tax=Streblomastix strix TaxID=222440 RepID=A0A5J4WI26_9EUKA|nr:MAG: hypothetical protein EZS28_009757 [Streblomastix strix]
MLDNYENSTNTNESAPEEPQSHINEVIIKHEKQLGSSPQPQYTITNVYNQFLINDFFSSSAYNTFDIVDDGTCSVCVFNLYFESKGLNGRTQEVDRIPDSIYNLQMVKLSSWPQFFIKGYDSIHPIYPIKSISKTINMNRFLMKAIHLQQARTIEETLLDNALVPFTNDGEHHQAIKEIKPESQMPAIFEKEIIIMLTASIQFDDKFDKIDESYKEGLVLFVGLQSACGTYINMREIEELIGNQTSVPYTIPIRFRINIPFDDLLIFSAFTDYPNGLFGCTADLITGLHAEPLTVSGLKKLVCDVKPITINIKNYVIIEVTANMAGYKATDAFLNRVRQFYSQRPFVVPAQRVEVWLFPTSATLTGIRTFQNISLPHVNDLCLLFPEDARATTCFENPCYQNMQITNCGRNFPDMPMNTFDQQFFQLQLNASNLDLLFEATDEFEDALATSRNTATRRLNPHTDLTSFLITIQCERISNGALTFDGEDTKNQNTSVELRGAPVYQGATDSYYNVDTSGKRPPPPILCTVHDTFWLFSPAAGRSCIYDTNRSFDEVIGPLRV